MTSPRVLLIDLDDTLFPESAYVESGFRAVAKHLEQARDLPADYSFPSMMAFLALEGRGKIFDRVIERFEVRNAEGLVEECINVYRDHDPAIDAYSGVVPALRQLSERFPLALVTNGLPAMQKAKLDALGIAPFFKTIVFCDALNAPKPAPEGLLEALRQIDASAGEAVFVGDNPETDGVAARAASVPFVRVRTERFADLACNSPELASFSELPAFLDSGAGNLHL